MKKIQDKEAFDALFELHKQEPDILVSNGFLERVRDNSALLAILDEDEQRFYDDSLAKQQLEIKLSVDALEEGNKALIEAEERAKELDSQKQALELANKESHDLRLQAEANEEKANRQRDSVMAELESTAQYQMQTDRQRRQFLTAQAHGYPAWALLYVFVIGIFVLNWFEKPGVDVLVPVLAGVLGALFQAYSGAFSSLFTPLVREEQKPSKNGKGREPVSEP